MGRATIDSEYGLGKYRVSVDFGQTTLDDKIAALQSRISDLEAEQSTLEGNVTQAQADVLTAQSELTSAINSYRASIEAGGSSGKSEVEGATRLALAAQVILQQATSAVNRNKFEIAEAQTRADYLSGFDLTEERDAWCADYTLEATGEVATAEVPGEADAIVIVPGADPATDADGAAIARPAQESHQLYFNYAILPGWQKFSPTYRFGQITAIDRQNDTCSVTLEAATSSAQGLDVNQTPTLENVPIEYMTCNAAAFEVWDYALVKFEGGSWSSPKVVGFKEEPRPCAPARMFYPFEQMGREYVHRVTAFPGEGAGPPNNTAYAANDYSNTDTGGGAFGYRLASQSSSGDFGPYPLVPAPELGIEAPVPGVVSVLAWGYSIGLRLRFDVAWYVETQEQLIWQPLPASQAYTETTYGTDKIMEPQVSAGAVLSVSNFGNKYQLHPASNWALTEILPGTGNNAQYIGDDYITGSETIETYNLFDDEFNLNPGTEKDIAHAGAWVGQFFEIPQTITLIIEGAPVNFVFEGVGSHPEFYVGQGNGLVGGISVPPLDPPSGVGTDLRTDPYTMDFDNNAVAGVYYRRADLPAE